MWQNFLSFSAIFSPFTPLTTQTIKIFLKIHGDIIILHKCTKNHDHTLYCSWYMACDGCNCYFSFWANFCPFTPLTKQKIQITKKKLKKRGDIIYLHKCTKNHDNMPGLSLKKHHMCGRCMPRQHFMIWHVISIKSNISKKITRLDVMTFESWKNLACFQTNRTDV